MSRRFADVNHPRAHMTWGEWIGVSIASVVAVLCFFAVFILFLLTYPARAQDVDLSAWYQSLKQPDNPKASCCGEADGYYADLISTGPNGEMIATITDTRSDAPRKRMHVPVGTKIIIPNHKITWRHGNPTQHNIVFLSTTRYVYCFVQAGGV